MPFDPKHLSRFPVSHGVYLMKNKEGKILYIGKAKNLRQRVCQYFTPGKDGRLMVPYLTAKVENVDFMVVDSEKEALLLENNLIKKHQPKYNALLKDDKTYFSLFINHKHLWPMLRIVRYKGKPQDQGLYFGPYTQGHAARETLELLRRLFPLRQCSDQELIRRTRPCILYDLKRCVAPCVGKCTKAEYDELVKKVISFLKGHDTTILKDLQHDLDQAIENLSFEKADRIHKTIQAILATLEKQKVQEASGTDKDVLGLYRYGDKVVLTQMIFREGKLIQSYDHLFLHNAQEDSELLSSFILQHYPHQEELPQEILLPLSLYDKDTLITILSEDRKQKILLTTPEKGTKKALLEMAQKNAKAKFEREEENIKAQEQILMTLEEELSLLNYPEKIECFDNSHLSGTESVSAMVVFFRGEKDKKRYRTYAIKSAAASDDYGALKEVLTRRYSKAKEEDNLPDLIVIDGGKGHLNIALETLSSLNISTCDVISIAKEQHKHTKGITAERIFLPFQDQPKVFPLHSPVLFFLQKIRDEAHRFVLQYQLKKRKKKSFQSHFEQLMGIGPIKEKRLLRHFGSLKRILQATEEEWRSVKGITKKDIITLANWKQKKKDSEQI